jgi:hypothetical protein
MCLLKIRWFKNEGGGGFISRLFVAIKCEQFKDSHGFPIIKTVALKTFYGVDSLTLM